MRDTWLRLKARAIDFWAYNSMYVVLPFSAVAFCVLVYLMFHDVM